MLPFCSSGHAGSDICHIVAEMLEIIGSMQVHLTTRELECLHWVTGGKNCRDMGTIMGITEQTARWYLKSARSKLNCVTSAQAAVKAMKLGLMQRYDASQAATLSVAK
jgi:DNA-binding CsgD family transcriptional regulator